ncbi:MAG: hypothetical protein AB7H80_03425 [Candidatus Kapaibacterium sp.]
MSKKQRELEIPETSFDRQNRQNSLFATIIFHAALLLPLFLITCSPGTEPDELTLIEWGGGGDPNVNAPVGPTPQGEVDGGKKSTSEQQVEETQTEPTETTTSKSPDKIYEPKEKTSNEQSQQTETENSSSTPTSNNSDTDGQTDAAKGKPDGEGTTPTGGSGKGSASGFGLGAGRSWIVSPHSVIPKRLPGQDGTVTLSYVVKSDGRVTSISKVSGPTSLFNIVKGYLSRARANAAEPGSPDIRGTGTVTYN